MGKRPNGELAKIKRKKVVKAVAEGKTLKEAGTLAGYKETNAAEQASRVMLRPDSKILFRKLLDKVITDDRLASKYSDLLEATKVISATVVGNPQEANSETKDFIEVPDYPTQLKTADSISKLKGHMVEGNQTNIQINMDRLTDKQLREIRDGRIPKELE